MPLALPENRTWWELECPACKVGFCTFIETQVYCSYRCKDTGKPYAEKKRKEAAANIKKKSCKLCGKSFVTNLSKQRYCSKKCQQTVPPTGNPVGRPTLYKKKYCKELIKHMKQGLSYETFGAAIGVCKSAIYQWEAAHEEFAEAKRLAWQEYQLFWEKMGVHGTAGKLKGFNSTSYIYNVKCRFRNSETWKPIKEETEGHSFTFNMSYKPEELDSGEDE